MLPELLTLATFAAGAALAVGLAARLVAADAPVAEAEAEAASIRGGRGARDALDFFVVAMDWPLLLMTKVSLHCGHL